jgi:hypothetical protein
MESFSTMAPIVAESEQSSCSRCRSIRIIFRISRRWARSSGEPVTRTSISSMRSCRWAGDGANSNCGPTSLVKALHKLGLYVAGETAASSDGEAVDLARLSMGFQQRDRWGRSQRQSR